MRVAGRVGDLGPLVVRRRCSWRTNLIRVAGHVGDLEQEHQQSCWRSYHCIVHHP